MGGYDRAGLCMPQSGNGGSGHHCTAVVHTHVFPDESASSTSRPFCMRRGVSQDIVAATDLKDKLLKIE